LVQRSNSLGITLYKKNSRIDAILLMAIPLLISAFTHLWNPVGFPGIYYDEAMHIERGVRSMEGLGSQDQTWFYDHPFFAQIFLAGSFALIGYPQSLQPAVGDVHSIEMLYLIPRIMMVVLAIFDTFVIYKISESRYNRDVALIASVFFALMPISWVLRRVSFESIELPLILSSILFAIYCRQNATSRRNNIHNRNWNKDRLWPVALSGLLLGLAIFTDVPGLSMIPLVGFLVYSNSRSFKTLGLWLIPVILIPMFWPIYALSTGELDRWLETQGEVLWQTRRLTQPLFESMNSFLEMDPFLILIGTIGILYTIAVKRDPIPALWIFPLLVFVYTIQDVSFWHLIPLIPIFCIASAILIVDASLRIAKRDRIQKKIIEYYDNTDNMRKKLKQYGDFYLLYQNINRYYEAGRLRFNKQSANRIALFFTAVMSLSGLISAVLLLQTNVNTSYFSTVAYLVRYLSEIGDHEGDPEENIAVIGSPRYSWIPKYIFNEDYVYRTYTSSTPIEADTKLVIADRGFLNTLPESDLMRSIYNNTSVLATFNGSSNNFDTNVYPYVNLKYASPSAEIKIRTNHQSGNG
jgi:hypothetical protein